MRRLPPLATIAWTPEGVPEAPDFGDIYYSRAGGLAETEAVFLAGAGLPEAWRGRRRYSILELGFGAGLNVLATWRAWLAARAPGALLHFTSIEAFPMDVGDAARAHAAFPEIADLAARLRAAWPARAYGAQRIWLDEGFALTVIQGEALEAVRGFSGPADAVFLDGFAPGRNGAMWSRELMGAIAAACAPGARVATYSVAGDVRRALEDAGFAVEKKPGFARKRERLEGVLARAPALEAAMFPRGACDGRVAIVGAGIAGATLADALRRRGREVVLIERTHVSAGASFNFGALVMPRLDRDSTPIARLHVAAYLAAQRFYETRDLIRRCGVLQWSEDEAAMADLIADPPLTEEFLRAAEGGALHAKAGVVRPLDVIEELVEGCEIVSGEVRALAREGEAWRLIDAEGREIVRAAAAVLANGARIGTLEQSAWLPMRLSRGQMEWAKGAPLSRALLRGSYAAPLYDGFVFGATFDPADSDHEAAADDESRRRNLESLRQLSPELAEGLGVKNLASRASVRASTRDHSPLLGLMPDSTEWLRVYEDIAFGRMPRVSQSPCLNGLYAFGGLGARGFTLAPLLAEALASEINGEPDPLSVSQREAIHPARFLLRALKRRENIVS